MTDDDKANTSKEPSGSDTSSEPTSSSADTAKPSRPFVAPPDSGKQFVRSLDPSKIRTKETKRGDDR